MFDFTEVPIRRRADGSIDTNYYNDAGRRERGRQFRKLISGQI
ncbi:MAG: hypothetical protein AAF667_17215 [Pseudomonadota bacterium]